MGGGARAVAWLLKGVALLAWVAVGRLLERDRGHRRLGAAVVAVLVVLLVLSLWRVGRHEGTAFPPPLPPAARFCRPDAAGVPPPGPCGDLWRRAEQSNPAERIAAPPSVSVGAIWQALRAVGSPLADNTPRRNGRTYAEYIWDQGQRTGIDPAVMMGFFRQESRYGTHGMAVLTHSPSNRRPVGKEKALCNGDGCYAYVDNWFDGIDDIYRLLRRYVGWGLGSVDAAVPVWAPSSDHNDETAFMTSVRITMQQLNMASRTS